MIVGEDLSVLDTPGLPDPRPRNSDTYYNETVAKLRSVGYANAILFLVNQVRATSTPDPNNTPLPLTLNPWPQVSCLPSTSATSLATGYRWARSQRPPWPSPPLNFPVGPD